MSKQQAMLETLLGAAELSGNRLVAKRIRGEILKTTRLREGEGYLRFARAAEVGEAKCALRKAA